MTKFNGFLEDGQSRFGLGKHPDSAAPPGRWVIPLLGILVALVLSAYLMAGHSSTPASATDESSSSMTDILKAAVGAALALAWAVGGAWFGMRRARMRRPLDEPADHMRTPGTAYDSLRAPTCERMYDETRLVPHFLRNAKFPTMKHDLVRLAREHTDEGQALRRLEYIPDRCYTSLHDLINEIRCD